ncbi:MAG: SDR family NAD(P)-dependent oxidoreductase [Saprospiraceae bacterium]|nr:SDR family NAD(P)-dependent oxidoreductase [Saprospiraceae bacterium]
MTEQSHIKVLITGASGFIGSHLVQEALDQGWSVYAGVRRSSSKQYLSDPRLRFFHVDLEQPELLHDDLAAFTHAEGGFDYIIHNAGVTKPRDAQEFVRGNADFTREFGRAARDTQPGLKKFVFMGSIAALGPALSDTRAIHERMDPAPITPYGKSKLLAEQYLEETRKLPYVTVRPAAVYGPRDEKMILRLIRLLERGIEVRLGPADQALSFVHVADLANVVIRACTSAQRRTSYLISDGGSYSQQHFNATIKSCLGIRTVAVRVPTAVLMGFGYTAYRAMQVLGKPVHLSHFKMREITARNWRVDISKARQELGFVPGYDLQSGVRHTVDWYLAHRERGKKERATP